MIDHSSSVRRRTPFRLSREVLLHLLIVATVFAIGGWTATAMLLWMLFTATF